MKTSKHELALWEILDFEDIKSTNDILNELMKKTNKVISWHLVYRVLKKFEDEGKVKRFENISGIFWIKK